MSLLKKRGCEVYLVSGGFISVISEAAKLLSIPPENIFCNRLKFYYSGTNRTISHNFFFFLNSNFFVIIHSTDYCNLNVSVCSLIDCNSKAAVTVIDTILCKPSQCKHQSVV